MNTLIEMGKAAQKSGRLLAQFTTHEKNHALHVIADALEAQADSILCENAGDIEQGRANGLSDAILDRLLLTRNRLQGLADDTRKVAMLDDPVGIEMESRLLPNGMRLSRRRTPIGVLGVIYEARPNVTIDIATLCLKTSNAVILRGGSETLKSNLALAHVIQDALHSVGFPADAVQYIANPDRTLVTELLHLDHYVDMIIPRGGKALHQLCKEQSTIPVITGGMGICHIFVDESADLTRALDIIENAKVQRPSVCNALDTLLVHESISEQFLPRVAERLSKNKVSFRAAGEAYRQLSARGNGIQIQEAGPDDFDQEWLGLILGVKIVRDVDEAIEHVHDHSTEHSDCILTNNWAHANRFVDRINASAVFVNASTRFNDGGQFGLGAEVAISTQKLHARGPMGLEELTTYKWICIGDGHIRT